MISKFQIASKNLLRKKTRTSLTLVGIILSSWVLVSLLGFNRGYEKALNRDIDNMGYQIMVMAKGCPYEAATMMLQGGAGLRYIEEDVVKSIEARPEVDKVTPILMQAFFDPNKGDGGGIAGGGEFRIIARDREEDGRADHQRGCRQHGRARAPAVDRHAERDLH